MWSARSGGGGKVWRSRRLEARCRHGDVETWRSRDLEARCRNGDMEVWRLRCFSEVLEGVRRVLLCMLEAVKGQFCLLEMGFAGCSADIDQVWVCSVPRR
jgi:hypothetical protein